MNLERIEQALRDGPPDEPTYAPGSFGRPRRAAWWIALAGATVTAAVVVGIAIGVGFDAVRGPLGAPPPPAVMADLDGTWVSDEISFDRWLDEVVNRGFDPSDVGEFLLHDPFERHVRYQLAFDSGRVTISADYDDTGMQLLNHGEYTLQEGIFSYVESTDRPPVIGQPCGLVARPALDGSRLVWENVELLGCGVDSSIATTVFFDLLPYTRPEND